MIESVRIIRHRGRVLRVEMLDKEREVIAQLPVNAVEFSWDATQARDYVKLHIWGRRVIIEEGLPR